MITSVSEPSMVILPALPEKNTGVAVLFAPGGGYGGLGADLIKEIADWFQPRGITCVLLKYRVPKRHQGYDMHFQPLQDAQRAMGILRSRAAEWGINPHKIGFAGASAGGNLAACLLMNHTKRWYEPIDDFDRTSCRPDFGLLLYPAYLTNPIISRERVLKLGFDHINAKDTPPTLTTIAYPDKFTFGSMEFYLALRAANVPADLHIYGEGGHGGGIKQYPFGQWAQECMRFLDRQKILPAAPANSGPSGPSGPSGTASKGETVALDGSGATLSVMRPSTDASGRAVVICPEDKSSDSVAAATRLGAWLGGVGMTAVVLTPGNSTGGPAENDLAAAMRLVRGQADKWQIDPGRIGVCGIGRSATAAALAGASASKKDDGVNPAFVILLSPKGLGDSAQSGKPDPRLVTVRRTSPPGVCGLIRSRPRAWGTGRLLPCRATDACDRRVPCVRWCGSFSAAEIALQSGASRWPDGSRTSTASRTRPDRPERKLKYAMQKTTRHVLAAFAALVVAPLAALHAAEGPKPSRPMLLAAYYVWYHAGDHPPVRVVQLDATGGRAESARPESPALRRTVSLQRGAAAGGTLRQCGFGNRRMACTPGPGRRHRRVPGQLVGYGQGSR